jgi:hypothetical protein
MGEMEDSSEDENWEGSTLFFLSLWAVTLLDLLPPYTYERLFNLYIHF